MISKADVLFKLDQAFCAQIEKLFSVLHVARCTYQLHDKPPDAADERFADGLRQLIETRQAAEECVQKLFERPPPLCVPVQT